MDRRKTQDPPQLLTLVDSVRAWSVRRAEKVAVTFLADGEAVESQLTYADLDRAARRIAARLQEHNIAGERALLLYPPGLEFITAFFGCLYAGVTAVPAYPPRLNRPSPRIEGIVADSQASVALTTSKILSALERRFSQVADDRREWRPQLVADGSQECRLELVELLELVVRCL